MCYLILLYLYVRLHVYDQNVIHVYIATSVKNISKNVKYNVGIHQKLLKLDGIRGSPSHLL